MARVNFAQLRRELTAQEAAVIKPRMKTILEEKFKEEKAALLREFDEHKVTQELNAGPDAQDSNFISTKNGGNLYSVLGFVNGITPAQDLRYDLENGISKGQVTKSPSGRARFLYNLEVRIPTLGELKRRTKLLKWTTRSFIDVIENGIGNFRRYMFDNDRFRSVSRSGTGIQIKNDIKDRKDVGPIEYISKLIKDFQQNLRDFNKKKK
jgi:hypothetical protein